MNFRKVANKIIDFIIPIGEEWNYNKKRETYVMNALKMAYTQGQIDKIKEFLKKGIK